MANKKIPTLVHLSEQNKTKLKKHCHDTGLSQSSTVNLLIAKNLKDE